MKQIIHVNSITQARDFLGLPKPKHPLVSVLRFDEENSDVDFSNIRFVINLSQISLKAHTSQHINYGRNSYDFEEGTMLFTKAGQTLEFESKRSSAKSRWL